MKKILFFILIFITLVGIFGPVVAVKAADTSAPYQLLQPLPDGNGGQQIDFNTSDSSALGKYINLIIKLTIGISAVLAVVMIVMGGIEYMGSELISSKEAGKERIQNAILGLLIALGAYALLNTINPDLLNSNVKIDTASVTVMLNDDTPQTPINGKYSDGRTQGTAITGQQTLPSFAHLYNSECTTVGQSSSCTSTAGLILAPLTTLHNGCGCDLTITGGTESWKHGGNGNGTTHQPGSGTVDLAVSDSLTKYFTGGATPQQNKWYQTPAGYAWYEVNHWHFNPSGPH